MIIALLLLMIYTAWDVSAHSKWESFHIFKYLFVAPFAFCSIAIPVTARLKWMVCHWFLGNLLLKACLAVPVARAIGSALQRLGMDGPPGFYTGISIATALGVAWHAYDFRNMLRDQRLEQERLLQDKETFQRQLHDAREKVAREDHDDRMLWEALKSK